MKVGEGEVGEHKLEVDGGQFDMMVRIRTAKEKKEVERDKKSKKKKDGAAKRDSPC